jgi:hypothetical protein
MDRVLLILMAPAIALVAGTGMWAGAQIGISLSMAVGPEAACEGVKYRFIICHPAETQ